ncbi:MAG: diguanylate cyclase, partial [Treponemataceae bacterium]
MEDLIMPQASSETSADTVFLRGAEMFSALLDDDLTYISSRSSSLTIPRGGRLFQSGDTARRFFIVKSGSIRVFRPRFDGGEDVMALFAPGDALGDFDFARGAVYDACADAVTDSEIIAFPGDGLCIDDLAHERPDVASRLKLRSLVMIASRLRSTNKLISENAPWVRELRRRAYEDPGTGLWSRAFLDEEVSQTLEGPTAIIVLKPNHFKDLVDERGHAAGDEAMVRIAAVLKELVRRLGRGWAIRIRSNETALVVPQVSVEEARETAETVRREIAAIEPFAAEGTFSPYTFTATVVYSLWPSDGADWSVLFGSAYDACIEAWKVGDT